MDTMGTPQQVGSNLPNQSEAKRRKLRKGTHSCWECKRRKIRCIPATFGPCQSCVQRGTACINQENPEGEIISTEMKNPMVRVEALINQLARKVESSSEVQPKLSFRTPESMNVDVTSGRTPTDSEFGSTIDHERNEILSNSLSALTTESRVQTQTIHCPDASKYAALSRSLHAAFPSQEDANILWPSSKGVEPDCYQVNIKSHNQRKTEGPRIGRNFGSEPAYLPGPNTHPVILGKQMLIYASLIQQMDISYVDGLSEPPRTIMKRLADTAINLVSTNEELLGTTESIECIILEAVFQHASGNLRRAWLAFRRAMMVAQLMGIDRPHGPPLQSLDPSTKINPQFLWFRIVYMDRFFSMMLGLPQGTTDVSMGTAAALAAECPLGKLERTHAVIAARILERKERDPVLNIAATKEIDAELLKAAKEMPPKFWLPPDFSGGLGTDPKQEFWTTLQLVNQLVHYNIINQLHLPYLLRTGPQPNDCRYSKMACMNASREILTRFITYTSFNHFSKCCRFFALPAAMTLLLAHLDSHHHQDMENYLAHQRLSDRAMTEKVLESLEQMKETNEEVSGEKKKGENILQCLLQIEAEAANGQPYTARCVRGLDALPEDGDMVRLSIPYFGIIKITREGISKESSRPKTGLEQGQSDYYDTTGGTGSVHASNQFYTWIQPNAGIAPLHRMSINLDITQAAEQTSSHSTGQQHTPPEEFTSAINDLAGENQGLFPGLTAGVEDWAFQGVDNAFFDNLMMLDGSSDWVTDWQSGNSGSI